MLIMMVTIVLMMLLHRGSTDNDLACDIVYDGDRDHSGDDVDYNGDHCADDVATQGKH